MKWHQMSEYAKYTSGDNLWRKKILLTPTWCWIEVIMANFYGDRCISAHISCAGLRLRATFTHIGKNKGWGVWRMFHASTTKEWHWSLSTMHNGLVFFALSIHITSKKIAGCKGISHEFLHAPYNPRITITFLEGMIILWKRSISSRVSWWMAKMGWLSADPLSGHHYFFALQKQMLMQKNPKRLTGDPHFSWVINNWPQHAGIDPPDWNWQSVPLAQMVLWAWMWCKGANVTLAPSGYLSWWELMLSD